MLRSFGANGLLLKSINSVSLAVPIRSSGVKKKYDYSDNPSKHHPSVLVKTLRGFQFNDGDFVYKGDILVRQLGLEIYPGESVKLDRESWDLVALANGRFMISTEILNPRVDSPLYSMMRNNRGVKKPFVHVISEPCEPVFKLKRML